MEFPTLSRSATLLGVFLFAVLIRLCFVQFVVGFERGATELSVLNGDERDYILRAQNSLRGNGLSAGGAHDKMWRTPGYPFFLAGLLSAAGKNIVAIRLVHCLLGGIVCVLLYLMAESLFDRSLAIGIALYFGLYPPHAYMAGQVLAENLLLPTMLASIMAFLKLAKSQHLRAALLTGALAGISILIKPESLVVTAAFLLTLRILKIRKIAVLSFALAMSVIVVISPWLIRNYKLSGHFILSSVGGEAFWGGNNEFVLNDPNYRGYWMPPSKMPEQLRLVLAAPTEYAQDRVRWRLGLEFLDAHRGELPRLAFYKLRRFYSVYVRDPNERLALILSFGLLLPFIAAGTLIQGWRLFKAQEAGAVLPALILAYNAVAIVFWGANRLRLMIDPFLILYGLWALRASLIRAGVLFRVFSIPCHLIHIGINVPKI